MRIEQRLQECSFSRFICLCQGHKCRSKTEELLVSIGLDNFLEGSDLLGDLGVLHAGSPGLGHLQLALVESLSLHLPLDLKSGNNVLVLPANLRELSLSNIETLGKQ